MLVKMMLAVTSMLTQFAVDQVSDQSMGEGGARGKI